MRECCFAVTVSCCSHATIFTFPSLREKQVKIDRGPRNTQNIESRRCSIRNPLTTLKCCTQKGVIDVIAVKLFLGFGCTCCLFELKHFSVILCRKRNRLRARVLKTFDSALPQKGRRQHILLFNVASDDDLMVQSITQN